MASYQTLPSGKTKVYVRNGPAGLKPDIKTFKLKRDAETWARDREQLRERGATTSFGELRETLVADLLRKFAEEVAPKRKGWKWETNRLAAYQQEPWSFLNLTQDVPAALRAWRDARLRGVKGQTVNRDLNLIGSVFTYAKKEWGLSIENFAHQVKRPATEGGERDIIWTDDDLRVVLEHFEFDPDQPPTTSTSFVPWVLIIARHTGLRLGNVHHIHLQRELVPSTEIPVPFIDWAARCIRFDKRFMKMPVDYDCPLNKQAVEWLSKLAAHRAGMRTLIKPNKGTIDTLWRRHRALIAEEHPRIAKLHIHDLRHTWTTEAVPRVKAKGHDDLMLAKITGRRSVKSLFRYFNPQVAEMADILD
jgi:integrase